MRPKRKIWSTKVIFPTVAQIWRICELILKLVNDNDSGNLKQMNSYVEIKISDVKIYPTIAIRPEGNSVISSMTILHGS